MSTDKRQAMLALVKQSHASQFRNKERKTPYWLHCAGVAALVEGAYIGSGMAVPDVVYLAALGHDLYEDTDVAPELIQQEFGYEVHQLIQMLTNEEDDQHRIKYMQKLQDSSEQARLIKLADMIDNIFSVVYNLDVLGMEWLEEFFLPIMKDTIETLSRTTFDTLSEPANLLIGTRDMGFALLLARQGA